MVELPWIGLCGKKRSGKDTAADYLVETYGYRKLGFADPMRLMASIIDPVVGFDFTSGGTPVPLHYKEAVARYGYDEAKRRYPELRRFLQRLGTEWGRETQGEDYWVDKALACAGLVGAPVVFTDVRFPNEADALVFQRDALIVRIVRPGLPPAYGDKHPSETSLDAYPVDAEVENGGTIQDLNRALDRILKGQTP